MAADSTTQLQGLIDQMVAGDVAARNELIGRAYRRLHGLAHKMLDGFTRLRPFEDTDDVLHDCLPRLTRALETVPPKSVAEFFRLASRQMRWELLDLVQRYCPPGFDSKCIPEPGSEDAEAKAFAAPASTYNPVVLAQWSEFHNAVETLPEMPRKVFELLWYHEMTYDEAAAVLEIGKSTVRRQWLEAKLRLGQFLTDDQGE
jgi:RNA polymerase sigma-70 factor (ECF subfamily)